MPRSLSPHRDHKPARGIAPALPDRHFTKRMVATESDDTLKTCTKCGGVGHLVFECYNSGGTKYDLIPDEDMPPSTSASTFSRKANQSNVNVARHNSVSHHGSSRTGIGRGRAATLPSWMTTASGNEGANRTIIKSVDGQFVDHDHSETIERRSSKQSQQEKDSSGKYDQLDSRGDSEWQRKKRPRSDERSTSRVDRNPPTASSSGPQGRDAVSPAWMTEEKLSGIDVEKRNFIEHHDIQEATEEARKKHKHKHKDKHDRDNKEEKEKKKKKEKKGGKEKTEKKGKEKKHKKKSER